QRREADLIQVKLGGIEVLVMFVIEKLGTVRPRLRAPGLFERILLVNIIFDVEIVREDCIVLVYSFKFSQCHNHIPCDLRLLRNLWREFRALSLWPILCNQIWSTRTGNLSWE